MLSRYRVLITFLIVFMLCNTAYILCQQNRLKVSFLDSVFYLEDSEFILQWRHSVELQNWQEHYRASSDQLFLEASYMQTFGAGTPSSGEIIQAPEGYIGLRSGVVLPYLNWVVSSNMQGALINSNGVWKIFQIVPDYTEVIIKPLQAARIFFWLGNNCYDYGYFSSDYQK